MIVYKTTNLINGKVYIGKDRKNNPSYLGSGILLQKAIRKYGSDNFKKETLFVSNNEDEINKIEIIEIKKHKNRNTCYNIAEGGNGGHTTKHYTEAQYNKWKLNLAKAQKGKTVSVETKKKLSEANKGKFFGNEKTISMSLKGAWNDPNSVFNSKEYREKLSEAAKGRTCIPETRAKISKANSGSNNGRAVSFNINGKIFGTRREAALAYNISETAVSKRCKSKNFTDWLCLK